jgi:Rrf2 family iron-sulfur cluster assembly transcriptional regulator
MQALPKGDNFMLISSKGRYTLYVLVDLAKNGQNRYIPLKEIAERQNISKKYMEGILKTLVDRNLLEGVKGKGGGYKLTKEPKDYSLGEILRLTEGDLASVPCTSKIHEHCNHMESCPSHPIWQQLDNLINNYLDSVTLANLLNNE